MGQNRPNSTESSIAYAKRLCSNIETKANSNKRTSDWLFRIIIFSTTAAPIMILLPWGEYVNRFTPAFLTAAVGIATSWMQLRKPNERWLLYRRYQRLIEYEIDQYTFGVGSYKQISQKDRILAGRVSRLALGLHYEWEPIMPSKEDIFRLKK